MIHYIEQRQIPGLRRIYLFGSTARGTVRSTSDTLMETKHDFQLPRRSASLLLRMGTLLIMDHLDYLIHRDGAADGAALGGAGHQVTGAFSRAFMALDGSFYPVVAGAGWAVQLLIVSQGDLGAHL